MAEQQEAPAPMTPPDCNLQDFPFMPMDIARLFNSEFHSRASDAEWRAAVTLWLKSYHQVPAGSVPDDDISLARLAEFARDIRGWRRVRAVALYGWVKCTDGRLYHHIVCAKALEAWIEKLAQRRKSGAGNAKRWGGEFDPAAIDEQIRGSLESLRLLDPSSRTLLRAHALLPVTDSHKESPGDAPRTPTGNPQGNPRDPSTESQGTGTGTGTGNINTEGTSGTSSSPAGDDPAAPPGGAKAEDPPPCPHLEILALWREVLPAMPQHDPKKWHKTRREHLQTRWRETAAEKGWRSQEQGLAYFRKLFSYVGASRFLTGRVQSRDPHKPAFVIELEWLILPSNWAKVHEGKYHAED